MSQRRIQKARQKAVSGRQKDGQDAEVTGPRPEVRRDIARTWFPQNG